MVVVKVRETYDLHTVENKMTVIGIHTPKPDIVKKNYPGLLMQCRAYRPISAAVRVACASVLPLDPLGVGTEAGDVAPEDVFNPILYKAMSNKGMSQLEARINALRVDSGISLDVDGRTAAVDVDQVTATSNEFNIYYGLLSNTHDWRHANPQNGFEMSGLRPLVYEKLYSVGDTVAASAAESTFAGVSSSGGAMSVSIPGIIGGAKPLPFMNTTSYTYDTSTGTYAAPGFADQPGNCEQMVPWICCYVAAVIIPPSRLHSLYFRMVVEWDIEFSGIRPLSEIVNWSGLSDIGNALHYQNYSYTSTKESITGDPESMLDSDSCMVASNVDVNKVM